MTSLAFVAAAASPVCFVFRAFAKCIFLPEGREEEGDRQTSVGKAEESYFLKKTMFGVQQIYGQHISDFSLSHGKRKIFFNLLIQIFSTVTHPL